MLMYPDHFQELIRLWLQFVDFFNFDAILTLQNGSNLGFPGILVVLCGFPHYGDPLAEIGLIGVSGHYQENMWE